MTSLQEEDRSGLAFDELLSVSVGGVGAVEAEAPTWLSSCVVTASVGLGFKVCGVASGSAAIGFDSDDPADIIES